MIDLEKESRTCKQGNKILRPNKFQYRFQYISIISYII